jgi:hypothetical protein
MNQASLDVQFNIFLVNKPGVLARITRALAAEKVNIVALTLVDSQEHGVLRLVANPAEAARQTLRQLNLPVTETPVLRMELPNRPGALADIAGKLGEAHVNINYAYCTSGAPGGRTTAVVKVADLAKAQKVLKIEPRAHKEPNLRKGGMSR